MNKIFNSNKNILLFYLSIMGGLTLLSLFALIFGIYEISAILAISTAFNFFTILIMLKTEIRDQDQQIRISKFVLFSLLRFILMACGIFFGVLVLYFTNKDESTYRYLYALFSVLPIFCSLILYYIKGSYEHA